MFLLQHFDTKMASLMQRRLHQEFTSEDNTEDDSMHNTMQTSGADDQISPASIPATVERQTTTKLTHVKTRALPHHKIYHLELFLLQLDFD